jgi:hypothetical protein
MKRIILLNKNKDIKAKILNLKFIMKCKIQRLNNKTLKLNRITNKT